MTGAVAVLAPAKVNLGLRVAALRGDGYHEIDTLFATLDLADRLVVERVPTERRVDGTVRWAGDVPERDRPAMGALPPMDGDNLAWRAAEAWLEAAGTGGGVHIALEKRIPIASGLGGGSSDAGAVLRALASLEPDGPEPEDVAGRLGSDVPFFARGLPSARGRGRGERLTPLELPTGHLVLANAGVAVPVADAYAALQNFGPPLPPEATVDALRRGLPPAWRNDLQPGVLRGHPRVRETLTALRDLELTAPTLSGSGGTCFALARDAAHAEEAAAALRAERPDWWCRSAAFPAEPDALEPRRVG